MTKRRRNEESPKRKADDECDRSYHLRAMVRDPGRSGGEPAHSGNPSRHEEKERRSDADQQAAGDRIDGVERRDHSKLSGSLR